MGKLSTIFKDTAIYGLSSIIGRFINWLLVPLYTTQMPAASGGYGVITNVYAYTALVMVLLTFGMETTYFRYTNKTHEDSNRVYSTTLISVGLVSLLFAILVVLFVNPISQLMGYGDHPSYVWVMAITVAIDAFLCIPFAHLRQQKKALKFAALKLLNIVVSILLNIIYFAWMDGKEVGYAFYINLFCSAMLAVCLVQEIMPIRYGFDSAVFGRMIRYAWPILILGIAGILNQTADKMLFPYFYPGSDMHAQLGIYGACSKIAMVMAMITQAFRYAYEPIVFAGVKDKDQHKMYEQAMKYFIIFTLLAFLMVVGYLDLLKFLIGSDYWSGLRVVPVVMAAEVMMGVYFNLSFWYKITDRTIWGAVFSGLGCAVLLAVNIIFVPKYGYMACAWGGVAGYGVAMVASYVAGQKYYPLNYPLKDIASYVFLAALLTAMMLFGRSRFESTVLNVLINTGWIVCFMCFIVKQDLPLSSLPFVGKYFKK